MNIDNLNNAIEYIEKNLTNKIDYKKLSKIVGLSEQSFNRVFSFLTDNTITEYIRKRRLSRAYEELKNSDIKIIDLATKYNYESDISFTRAFKKMFGITPSECRKSNNEITLYPVANFSCNHAIKELKYKIIKIKNEKEIWGFNIEDEDYDDYLYKIRELYSIIENLDIYKEMNDLGMYGISIIKDNKYEYILGSESKLGNFKKIIIPKGQYIVFEIGSREQQDIVKTFKSIYVDWLPSTSYNVDMNFCFEVYKKDNCFLHLMLKK